MSYYQSAESLYNYMITNVTNVDTTEDSYIYNALMPVCIEMAQILVNLDESQKKVFASSAYTCGYSKFLERRVAEMGITRKAATYAKILVKFIGKVGTIISANTIVGTSDNRLYKTLSEVTIGSDGTVTVYVLADGSGSTYNVKIGEINNLPTKLSGITSVTNESAYDDATDDETDEALYNRYIERVQLPATSGNSAHYKEWALSVDGIGSAMILPLWNGNGTVKIVVADTNKRACSADLVQKVADYIATERPIGATVTVVSIEEIPLNIVATITYDTTNYTLATIKTNIESAITTYLSTLTAETNTTITYNKLMGVIVNTTGVTDISNLTINGATTNVTLTNTQVAVLGTVTLS